MRRMPIRHRTMSFPRVGMPPRGLRGISRDFSRLSPCGGQVAYVLLTRAPVAGKSQQADPPAAPRLACVKPVASVHPEPGSNSSLLYLVVSLLSKRIVVGNQLRTSVASCSAPDVLYLIVLSS